MRILFALAFSLLLAYTGRAQTSYNKSKLEFCKKEVEGLEDQLDKYKKLLDMQSAELMEVKTSMSEMKDEIKRLESANYELKAISVSLLNLGLKFEKKGELQNAISIYKFLIKEYPTSLEAASSRIKVDDIEVERESSGK